MKLWEILVPYNIGSRPMFKEKIMDICGGFTIPFDDGLDGAYKSNDGTITYEGIIPYRIACTIEQLNQVIDYMFERGQEAVLCYEVSNNVIFKKRA